MRRILGGYTHLAAQEVVFSNTAKGKPELSGNLQESGIKFNLSHSAEIALLAVANGLALGIDIELMYPTFDTEEIAARFFSEREAKCLKAISAEARAEAFFACWTRKEAYIKAVGEGLADCFEVAVGSEVKSELLVVKVDPSEVERWSMYDVEVPELYKAALVVEGRGHLLRHLEFNSATRTR
jgi:4'-phosphopantetheinyl transferase